MAMRMHSLGTYAHRAACGNAWRSSSTGATVGHGAGRAGKCLVAWLAEVSVSARWRLDRLQCLNARVQATLLIKYATS
jgi:hypothetical protein